MMTDGLAKNKSQDSWADFSLFNKCSDGED